MARLYIARTQAKRLSPTELAEAAVMADLAVGVVIIARLTPFAYLTTVLGAIPFAVLAMRHRRHVLVVSFWISVILAFLLTGFAAATQVLVMAIFGGVSGRAYAHGWGGFRTSVAAIAFGWTVVTALSLGILVAFSGFRRLNLEAAAIQWTGSSRVLHRVGLGSAAEFLDPIVVWSIENWYLSLPASQLVFSVIVAFLISRIGGPTIKRVDRSVRTEPSKRPIPSPESVAAVQTATGFVAVTGPNGAGKSTLLRAVAVAEPGVLGERGGIAWIGQRPDNQILGTRVLDDLAWGLKPVPELETLRSTLEAVGLAGFDQRETDTLSGGEQQRLAIAAALIRNPTLLLSDETTAMLDPDGRELVRDALRAASDSGINVIHATHLESDIASADRQIQIGPVTP
ncbi:MAG: DUF2232 domain-containing protein [Acidimicrobiales bacterium]|nr:DUF2232 domain-containing protein [Acidimicrobiales bacterium]